MRKTKIAISLFLCLLVLTTCFVPAFAYDIEPENCTHGSYEWVTDSDAGCNENGAMHLICNLCGQTVFGTEGTVIPATGHDWKIDEEYAEAPCLVRYICENCGEEKIEKLTNAQHSWNDGEIYLDATCGSDGIMVYTCSDCESQKSEVIPATKEHDDADRNGLCDKCGVSVSYKTGGTSFREIIESFFGFFINLFNRFKAIFS